MHDETQSMRPAAASIDGSLEQGGHAGKYTHPVEIFEAELDGQAFRDRYSRQVRFGPIGPSGQDRLRAACVLIVGTGALGASLAQHMARAGVGVIRLADRDFVEPSNLQRQMLFDEDDARDMAPKAIAAARKLRRINSGVRLEAHVADVGERTIGPLLDGVDLVLDGTDNAASRLAISDACFRRGIPLLYGGVTASEGMSAALIPGRTACLRCLIGGEGDGEDARTCDTAGVISPAVEFVAALQAAEALKWLGGSRESMRGTWVMADVWSFAVREAKLPGAQRGCPHCGGASAPLAAADPSGSRAGASPAAGGPLHSGSAAVHASSETAETANGPNTGVLPAEEDIVDGGFYAAAVLCGRDSVQVTLGRPLALADVQLELESRGCEVAVNPYLARALLPEGKRLVLFADGRVIVQGTSDTEEAARLCRRFLSERRTNVAIIGG